jgi:galactokinase
MRSDDDRRTRAVAGHHRVFATSPDSVAFAPGRVNLIGEHTDYNGGLVLPIAIAHGTTCAVSRRNDDEIHVFSEQVEDGVRVVRVSELEASRLDGWMSYVIGSYASAAEEGWIHHGLDIWIDGEVPLGAGLSSSASVECSVLAAIRGLGGDIGDRMSMALAAQRAEHNFAGVPCGIMDQAASMLGRSGDAVLLDSASLVASFVPLHLEDMGLELLLINTNARHELSDGGYASRRADCESAARLLGVAYLADAGPDDMPRIDALPEPERRRARHVVSEHARVTAAVEAFAAGDAMALGSLFAASQASLASDFEVSCPELDLAVSAARSAGAVAARMTGGGFGGSTVNLVRIGDADAVGRVVSAAFAAEGLVAPSFMSTEPSGGARILD